MGRRNRALVAAPWAVLVAVSLLAGVAPSWLAKVPVPWSRVVSDVVGWLLWVPLLPLATWAVGRFPLDAEDDRRTLLRSVAAHLALGSTVVLLYAGLATLKSLVVLRLASGIDGAAFLDLFPGYLFGGLPLFAVVYAALLAAQRGREASRRLRERELKASVLEGRLAEARLQALKMQLDPHFLFNALNGVAAQLRSDPRAAENTLLKLSEFLRATLREAARQEVPLEEELRLLAAYVEVERARFGDRLKVSLAIAPEALSIQVPSLLLQPLVENAVRHGMKARGLEVRVAGMVDGDRLLLTVEDDGRGLPSDAAESREARREGVGLANTRARLRELYGERARLDLAARPEGGAVARVELPRRDNLEGRS